MGGGSSATQSSGFVLRRKGKAIYTAPLPRHGQSLRRNNAQPPQLHMAAAMKQTAAESASRKSVVDGSGTGDREVGDTRPPLAGKGRSSNFASPSTKRSSAAASGVHQAARKRGKRPPSRGGQQPCARGVHVGTQGCLRYANLCVTCASCIDHCACDARKCSCAVCEKRRFRREQRSQLRHARYRHRDDMEAKKADEQERMLQQSRERYERKQQQQQQQRQQWQRKKQQQQQQQQPGRSVDNQRYQSFSQFRSSSGISGSHSGSPYVSSRLGPQYRQPSTSSSNGSKQPHWCAMDPWICLELPMNSGNDAAKRAYRRLCLLYHPDKSKHPEATTAFLAITRAYQRIIGA